MNKTMVLIVDDEVLIRSDAAQIVGSAGFATMEACNADEAMEILESRDDVRMVFTDINMPGSMDGLRLAHAIRDRWPPIHLLLTSGLSFPSDRQLPSNGRFIRKPYAVEHVKTALSGFFS
jgi:CheY-like chemotaxis protein